MDKENINGNIPHEGADAPDATQGSTQPQAPHIPTAPYYNGVPPFSASGDGSAPMGYYSPQKRSDNSTPWRDPEYHSVSSEQNSTLYSPTGGYYGRAAYNHADNIRTSSEKKDKKGSFWRITALVVLCAFVSAVSTGLVLWAHDSAQTENTVLDSYAQTDSHDSSAGGNSQRYPGGQEDSLPSDQPGGLIPGTGAAETGSAAQDDVRESGIFTSTTDVAVTGNELTASQIYDMACEQVVGINLSVTNDNIFGQTSATACVGTGFVISEDGYIITCYHVIEYAMNYGYQVSVLLHDESEYPAEIIGYDEDGDLAVLKINVTGMNPVTIGTSGDLMVGETIYAVGNPLGELTYTMTDGIVSALNREISTDISASLYVFQINAAVNSGNSGGPVYNSRGMVVGIVDAKYADTGVEGLSFALPIDTAFKAAQEIITKGYVSGKAQLGISCRSASEVIQGFAMHYYNIPNGAIVVSVMEGSAAEKAGVIVNDVITAVDGKTITNPSELKSALREHSPGDTVTLTVFRLDTNETLYIEVVLDEQVPTNATQQG